MDALKLKIPPLILFIMIMLLMKIIAELLPISSFLQNAPSVFLYIFISIGVMFIVLGVVAFRTQKTTVNPTLETTSTALVITGVYRVTRNPMYVGFLCLLIASAIYFSSFYAFVGCALFIGYMNRFQIAPEEEYLMKLFPNDYPRYKEKVRRWL